MSGPCGASVSPFGFNAKPFHSVVTIKYPSQLFGSVTLNPYSVFLYSVEVATCSETAGADDFLTHKKYPAAKMGIMRTAENMIWGRIWEALERGVFVKLFL